MATKPRVALRTADQHDLPDDIAIIGIGLRFPGEASNPEKLWSVLERKESQWSEFPKDRLNIEGYFHPGGDRQGSISFRGAHFLKGDIGAFDAPFFSVTAEDAKAIDPQQRLLLEVSYEALENAGIRKEDVEDSDTSVYVGSFVKDYEQICLRDPDWQPQYAATGNGIAIMANRISYFYNLHGPSVTIDTGCSGSLVAVHLAAQSLRSGESSLAIAAGAGMILTPNTIMPMTALNFLSPDGRCFTFDSRANGYGRGEGVGVVIMKRLSDAIRDNDNIRSIIRGSSVNQDGRTTGITLPSKEAQVANIRSAYANAGLDMDKTTYVECHGTGTQAGDWRELKAISEALGLKRGLDKPIYVGSVKTNIGHLEGAAGVAGLIKGVLMMERYHIPPNINFKSGNPTIDFEAWNVKVPLSMTPWPHQSLNRISVNCFGFGGTNAHVVLEDSSHINRGTFAHLNLGSQKLLTASNHAPITYPLANESPQLFCYSAHERGGIDRVLKTQTEYLESRQSNDWDRLLSEYSYTVNCRRSNMEWKFSAVASSVQELISKLQSAQSDSAVRSSKDRQPRICFIFCGQGAQWAKMGEDLLVFKSFHRSIEQATLYLKLVLQSPFDLLEELVKPSETSRISEPHIAQPATTAIQVALVDLLRGLGVDASHVVGHSSGEIAAAYTTGAITRERAWEVAYYRGAAAASLPSKAPKLVCGMMAVGISVTEAEKYLDANRSSAQVACVNSPRSVTLSGLMDSLEVIAADLQSKKTFCRMLKVTTAYHSSYMELVASDYRDALGVSSPNKDKPRAQMFSSVHARAVQNWELDSEYWCKNLVSPVKYMQAVESMMSLPSGERPSVFLELSPTSALRSPTTDTLSNLGLDSPPTYFATLQANKNGHQTVLETLGTLWGKGCPVDMDEVTTCGHPQNLPKALSDLPPYPWNHEKSYWHESHLGYAVRFRKWARQDLIGAPTADSVSFEPRWRGFLRISENPWIQDHQVQKTIIYPAAGMVSMVLEGAKQVASEEDNGLLGYEITDMEIEKAMIIPKTEHGLEVALNMKLNSGDPADALNSRTYEFAVYSKQLDKAWERHASGGVKFRHKTDGYPHKLYKFKKQSYPYCKEICKDQLVPRQLYESLDAVGMNYGPLFQNITSISKESNYCVSTIQIPDTKAKMPANFEYPHIIHPATLDSMFQTLFAIDSTPMVPTFIKTLFVSANVTENKEREFVGCAEASRSGANDADASIFMQKTGAEDSCVFIDGLLMTGLSTTFSSQAEYLPNHKTLCTKIVWEQDVVSAIPCSLRDLIDLITHKYAGLTVLQVGGGLEMTETVLRAISAGSNPTLPLLKYTIVDDSESPETSDILEQLTGNPAEPFMNKISSGELGSCGEYHLVLSFEDSDVKLDQLKHHLKLGGYLLEHQQENNFGNGFKNGRHALNEDFVSKDLSLYRNVIDDFDGLAEDDAFFTLSVHQLRRASQAQKVKAPAVVLLMPKQPDSETSVFVDRLRRLFTDIRCSSVVTSQILDDATVVSGKVVISLLDFSDGSSRGRSVYEWTKDDFDAFHITQKVAKGVIWLTCGAIMQPENPHGSPILGLARTLMSEDPRKQIVTFDLAPETLNSTSEAVPNVLHIFRETFVQRTTSGPVETEYAERSGQLYIPRLVPIDSLNKLIEDEVSGVDGNVITVRKQKSTHKEVDAAGVELFKDETRMGCISGPEGKSLEASEVEISVEKAYLTSLHLQGTHGGTNSPKFALDVRGVVKRVGKGVKDIQCNDKVVALAVAVGFGETVHVHESMVSKRRQDLTDEGHILSPILVARYTMHEVGRVNVGRTVLVHAGASVYGAYAIQAATSCDAQIFATVMGPDKEQQRQHLETLHVRKYHILDADSDDWLAIVADSTWGKGVDVLFDPTQHHMEDNLKCVKKGGSIVQLAGHRSKVSSAKIPLGTVSTIVFDMPDLLEHDPLHIAHLWKDGLDTSLRSPPTNNLSPADYGLHELGEAMEYLENHPHLAFVTLTNRKSKEGSSAVVRPAKTLHDTIDPDGTYLLAGGLGGLGRSIAEMLVDSGARHLSFLSRSGASSETAKDFIKDLSDKGVECGVKCVDLCDEDALSSCVDDLTKEMPPICGVFQCAAVVKDAVFENMTYSDWTTAMGPKTAGSWNLVDKITTARQRPFFIFLASSAGVIGSRGQANYAAGNCFEDSLAEYCRIRGNHAVSIDLGPVIGAGMLVGDAETMDILKASGFYGIRHEDFLDIVAHAITGEIVPGVPMPAQVILGVGTGGLMHQNQPADPYWSKTAMYSYLNLVDMPPPDQTFATGLTSQDVKETLSRCSDVASAAKLISDGLITVLAKLMTLLPEEVDVDKTPNAYGMDSLVAIGVRNCVLSDFGVEISVFEVLAENTIAELALLIAQRGGYGGGTEATDA